MTLQQLEYVIAVYRMKHFSKAADYCNVTQPTLSSMIQKLEEELGVTIFDRQTNPIQPTREGKAVIDQAWKVLFRARKLRETVEEEKQSLLGPFLIGVLPTIAPYLIPRFFPQLMNEHPEMDLRIIEMKTKDMKKALIRGEIDAGILARVDGLEGMQCEPLFKEKYFAYVAKNDPLFKRKSIRAADLTGEYLWLLDEGHCFRDQLVKFCHLKAASRSKRAYTLGSIETFMRIVEHDKGVTFIPELAISQLSEEQKQLVRPFAVPVPTREIIMMTTSHFIRTTLLQHLITRIRSAVPERMLMK
ncbi:MAG: hydrogen peroxide-inducible genes activator [Prevotella sp.]|jgi:LysR family hydrogen peroxide-inducible transcriptional activator|nr:MULTISPECIES: hydrogen peroxide-inducible genes activator [unclassified Prevotella]MCH3970861.1 hydrogen peroxide-inducible genes activator [Prevotella sp.]MCH3985732.1 hydrogen peroxide-inducible genes activator [Prevotella sp.]MCH4017855.1 hydrogen peroxide-inducible genes activator [Prevotella sp.]MCH4186741.1 hydrogen peroxide-inducible genes activator [Prevotella sp.]MCH4252093.1 hydrogen peroxide-inducible genes activator [Prevotella sp.]